MNKDFEMLRTVLKTEEDNISILKQGNKYCVVEKHCTGETIHTFISEQLYNLIKKELAKKVK